MYFVKKKKMMFSIDNISPFKEEKPINMSAFALLLLHFSQDMDYF